MQIKRLFQLLVMGGAVLGAAAASYGSKGNQPSDSREKKPAPGHPPDGGVGSERGGGTQGW